MVNYQERRDGLNTSTRSLNFRTNIRQSQSALGDITLLDRVDVCIENKRNKDLYEVSIPHGNDHGVSWLNSLRQNEPDLERNGINQMRMKKISRQNSPAAENEINVFEFVPNMQ